MKAASTPAVSVIIPVHNAEKYLRRCLDSVIRQTFRDIEIICINDGSADSSPDILREYAALDSRMRIVEQENRGVSAARNRGLDLARGRFVSFVDCDDAIVPHLYETVLARFPEGADAACFSAREVHEFDGREKAVDSGYFNVDFSGLVQLRDEELLRLSMTVWDKLFLRERIESLALRFPEGICYEDNAFVLNYFSVCRSVFFMAEHLYFYFRHENSIMSDTLTRKEGLSFHYMGVLENIYEFWKKQNLFPEKQNTFEHICLFMFRAALNNCNDWEQAGLVYALARNLRKWGFQPRDDTLERFRNGSYRITAGGFFSRDIFFQLKHLKGLQRILYIGNHRDEKIICLFCMKIAGWKK